MEQEKPTKPETDRTFPEDDDTLYREMTVHMPRCYFPTSLGENSILKFAGEEFRRVKNIVCRRYNFNEDKYIRENAGVSPFDSVRGNFEQVVFYNIKYHIIYCSLNVCYVHKPGTACGICIRPGPRRYAPGAIHPSSSLHCL